MAERTGELVSSQWSESYEGYVPNGVMGRWRYEVKKEDVEDVITTIQ